MKKNEFQILFSKKESGLWPNAKAVAQRVKSYFEDLEAGKDVSKYGSLPEKAYTPKKNEKKPFGATAVPGKSYSVLYGSKKLY